MSNETEHSDGTPSPAAFTLPATGKNVPAAVAGLTLKVAGHMRGNEGWATTVEVRIGGALVGQVYDEGNGGGAWIRRGHTAHQDREWSSWVREMSDILKTEPLETFDGMELPHSSGEETLANRLIDEALAARDYDRKRSPVTRIDGDPDNVLVWKGAWDEEIQAYLRKTYPGQKVERWIKGQGWVNV